MQKYTKRYLAYFGYSVADWIGCERCNSTATEVHHLTPRSKGGGDEIENTMALCRSCHESAHKDPKLNESLKRIHQRKVKTWQGVNTAAGS